MKYVFEKSIKRLIEWFIDGMFTKNDTRMIDGINENVKLRNRTLRYIPYTSCSIAPHPIKPSRLI